MLIKIFYLLEFHIYILKAINFKRKLWQEEILLFIQREFFTMTYYSRIYHFHKLFIDFIFLEDFKVLFINNFF